jgi:hypothetical protein
VTVDMPREAQTDATTETTDGTGPALAVGDRLLVSGEPRWGGAPTDAPIAWFCGFTRYYGDQLDRAWTAALG